MTMKLLGDDSVGRGQVLLPRSQDDAAVGYVFQRHAHDPEFSQFSQKQHRWASGDDALMDVSIHTWTDHHHQSLRLIPLLSSQDKWKYNGLMNSGGGGLLNQSSKMSHSPQVQQMMNHHQQLQQQQMHMHPQQSHHLAPPQQHMQQQQQHHHLHPMGTNASALSSNNMSLNHLANAAQQQQSSQQQQQQQQAMSNYSMNNLTAAGQPLQMAALQGGLYDHQQHQSMNGMSGQMPSQLGGGTPKVNEHMVYLGTAQPHLMPQQNQYMTTPMNRNSMGVSTLT